MSEIVSALLVAQAGHRPPAAAHLVLLAGIVVAALAVFAVSRWRARRDDREARDLPPEEPRPREKP